MNTLPASGSSAARSSMAAGGQVRRNAALIFAGNICYAACQWGMIVFLARLYDPEMVGTLGLAIAVVTPLIMFSSMQLQTVLAADHRNERCFTDCLALRFLTLLAAMLVLVMAVGCGSYALPMALIILATGVVRSVESLSDICFAVFQKQGRAGLIACSLVMRGGGALAALSITMLMGGSLLAGIIATGAVSLGILLLLDLPFAWRSMKPVRQVHSANSGLSKQDSLIQWRAMLPLLVLGIPLGLAMMFNSLNMNIPRYFLAHWGGEHALGIFVALAFAMRAGFYVETALSQAAIPRLARLFAEQRWLEFCRLMVKLLTFATALGMAGLLVSACWGKQLLAWFYAPEYADHAQALNLMMIAAGAGYVGGLLKAGTDATQTYISQLPLFVVASALSLLAGWYLIPTHGIAGAAMTLIIARASLVIGYGGLLLSMSIRVMRRQLPAAEGRC